MNIHSWKVRRGRNLSALTAVPGPAITKIEEERQKRKKRRGGASLSSIKRDRDPRGVMGLREIEREKEREIITARLIKQPFPSLSFSNYHTGVDKFHKSKREVRLYPRANFQEFRSEFLFFRGEV